VNNSPQRGLVGRNLSRPPDGHGENHGTTIISKPGMFNYDEDFPGFDSLSQQMSSRKYSDFQRRNTIPDSDSQSQANTDRTQTVLLIEPISNNTHNNIEPSKFFSNDLKLSKLITSSVFNNYHIQQINK